jgi:predicted dehydrogenase
VRAQFDCGFDTPRRDAAEIVGSDGTIVVASPFMMVRESVRILRATQEEEVAVEPGDRYFFQVENFAGAIRGTAEPLLGRADAVGQVRTLDALRRSAASGGAPVSVR